MPDVTTPAPRRERIYHPELLEPIDLPRMRDDPQVIISMDDYRNYQRFVDVFVSVENLVARGRLEARIEAYQMVLHQVEFSDKLSAVRQPVLIESLQRIIQTCKEDLARLEAEAPQRPTSPPAELSEDEVTMFMTAMDNPRAHTLAERLRRGFAHVMSTRTAPVG